jgi:hypothetical protein
MDIVQATNRYDRGIQAFYRLYDHVQCVRRCSVSSVPAPQLPLFRVTLFYGPEPTEDDPARLMCVFNVKKRSWKGGVQIAVEVSAAQISRLQHVLSFELWIDTWLAALPEEERPTYESRARDLLIQEICSTKLTLALDKDVRQDNSFLPVDTLVEELDGQVNAGADRIKANILTELDLNQS